MGATRMRPIFYKMFLSRLSMSVLLSFVISKLLVASPLFFAFALAFFGGLFLLIGWIQYLQLDGVLFFNSKAFTSFKKLFHVFDRFSYKNKGVYGMDDRPVSNKEPSIIEMKVSIFAHVSTAVVLLIGSYVFSP